MLYVTYYCEDGTGSFTCNVEAPRKYSDIVLLTNTLTEYIGRKDAVILDWKVLEND